MRLSLVLLPECFSLFNKENELFEIVKLIKDRQNIELIILGNDKLENKESIVGKNISVIPKHDFGLRNIGSEYVLFIDRPVSFTHSFFDVIISAIENNKEYDFFQLLTKEKSEHRQEENKVDEMEYEDITSMKVIKKMVLENYDLKNFGNITTLTLTELYFDLFLLNEFKYEIIDSAYFSESNVQDKEFIISVGQNIRYLLDSKAGMYQHNFMILYKKALLVKLFHLIDNRIFVDLLPYDKQESILNILKESLLYVDNGLLENWKLNVYIPFTEMVREGLYVEGLYYIKLLRGKRYWYNTTKELEGKIKHYPIEDSLSWKVTTPLRKIIMWKQKIKNIAIKWRVQLLSIPVKLKFSRKEVWLVSERADQAEDNGYNFFKYCREKHPEKPIYYIINDDSPHVEKVKELGNVIYHSSLKHWIFMLVAKKYISAWVFEETSYPEPELNFKEIFGDVVEKRQQITLQHGVIIHNIAPYLNKDLYHQSLFIASSNAEKEVIKNTLGYNNEEVVVTGLSRFDNLHDIKVKKQILIMPTWRRSLYRLNQSEFLRSDYFYRYYHLIRNEQFLKLIEQEDIDVKFYIHNQMQKFMDEFVFDHPNIEFLTQQNSVVSELLKESALLITDYSSVMADFLYMEKPTLLFQFDPYNNHHGPVKEINYKDFGEIMTDEDSLVEKIHSVIKRKFVIEDKYKKNSDKFFLYKDDKNSERIFRAIEKLSIK